MDCCCCPVPGTEAGADADLKIFNSDGGERRKSPEMEPVAPPPFSLKQAAAETGWRSIPGQASERLTLDPQGWKSFRL